MEKNQKIREILKVLEACPKVNFTNLRKIVVEDKRLMAAQTFADKLKEGVESGIITREVDHYKKRKIVWYSKPEYAKKEDDYYRELISDVDSFSQRLEIIKEKFPKLNNIEKGQILFSCNDWLQVICSKIGMGYGIFGSSKFSELYQSVFPSIQEIVKLTLSEDLKQQSEIWNEFFLGWNDIVQDNIEEIDELLEHQTIPKQTKKYSKSGS